MFKLCEECHDFLKNSDIFFTLSKKISFRLRRLEPGFKSRASFSTNEKQKQIRSHLERAIFPALCASYRYVIVRNSDWLIVLFAPVLI